MNVGDIVNNSIWLSGEETPALRARYEKDVIESIDYLCHEEGFTYGPVTFTELHPFDERTPPVPDHIHGTRVRLLLAEAKITGKRVESPKGSFIANLDRKDLMRLRAITRQKWAQFNPGSTLTNLQCDQWIEELGPDTAIQTLRTLN